MTGQILSDPRPITCIFFPNEGEYKVGQGPVTKIVPYEEPGEMGMVTWFAVYGINSTAPMYRINSKHVEGVSYEH